MVFAYFEDQDYQYQRYAKYLGRVGAIRDTHVVGHARVYLVDFDR